MKLLQKLYRTNLLSPKGLFTFGKALWKHGINLMALLQFVAKIYPNQKAIHCKGKTITYQQLYQQSFQLAYKIKNKFQIESRSKVAILCSNHTACVQSLFAISRLGADVFFLNIEMSYQQSNTYFESEKIDLIIHDEELKIPSQYKSICINDLPVNNYSGDEVKLKKTKPANIIVLTGGTTGTFKSAKRKPSISNFLNPFFALLLKLDLDRFKSVFVATPIYHGYGLASLIVAILLGKEIFLLKKFTAKAACDLIKENNIEVTTLVPVMLSRMLAENESSLKSLKKILCGGAALKPSLVTEVLDKLGDVLYNLYGTSEAGFSIMASPDDLKYNNRTIGKNINGVYIKILDSQNRKITDNEIGALYIKSAWTMNNKKENWISTGDLAYRDKNGYLFLCGRSDDMIVSGGENVYPIRVENVLSEHDAIQEVAVIGIADDDFGQRLKAFIVPKENTNLCEKTINDWLKNKVARYEQLAQIEFIKALPRTALGKINRKELV